MSELDKNKAGLQKKVSSVFKGVPLPQNNGVRQPSGTPAPNQTPDVPPKPAPADRQTSRSSLISKLSQSEDSSDAAEQNQTANVQQKPASAKQMPQHSPINKLSQPKEPLKQAAMGKQPVSSLFIEETSGGPWQQIKDKLFKPKPGVSPAKQKAMVIMMPILAIIMVFAFRQVLSKAPQNTKGNETDDTPVVTPNADSGNEIDWQIPEPITIITRDPTKLADESNTLNGGENAERNGAANTENHGAIIIKDIVYSTDKPSAVIGSQIVYVGDKIHGMTVVKIDRDSVEFEKDGNRWEQNVRDGKMIPVLDGTGQSEDKPESVK
ncbi:MAG: hypothetical protein JXA81_04950 [Sedimentisphaerales bacterium]|nr:hypothetical protein [Sedimentisphaerales bacterium]